MKQFSPAAQAAVVALVAALAGYGGWAIGAEGLTIPDVEGKEHLATFFKGVAAADAQEDPLVVVCLGDSNTEGTSYIGEFRSIFQGCYGQRGLGYHSFGARAAIPGAPKIVKKGEWQAYRLFPNPQPKPWFAVDGFWAATSDPNASITVNFDPRSWRPGGDKLARSYNSQNQVRVHYQTGPDLGSFSVLSGTAELLRVNCQSAKPGYGVTKPLLVDAFGIGKIKGKVIPLGYDGERTSFRRGREALPGGAIVHQLGMGWGMASHFAAVEQEAYTSFMKLTNPDLITILFGTNDMHNDGRVATYEESMTTLIQKLQKAAPGVGILVISCPEAGQTKEGLAAKFRDTAKAVAAKNNCAFWDLQALIGPRSRHWTELGFFGDGLHYHPVGGALWARLLLRQLDFDINDLEHYPSLRRPQTDAAKREAISVPRFAKLALVKIEKGK